MAFILIVEASEALARRAFDVLTAAGHDCGWVSGVKEALALLHWRAPDLILLDQAMPGADGGALPAMLQRVGKSGARSVILLTTQPPTEPRDSAVVDDIQKPFDPDYLAWRVNHALQNARPAFFATDVKQENSAPSRAVPSLA